MAELGRFIILAGIGITILGLLIWGLGRVGFRGMPGDISYEGSNVRVYFPIVSCIVLSILLTGGMWLWRWLSGR